MHYDFFNTKNDAWSYSGGFQQAICVQIRHPDTEASTHEMLVKMKAIGFYHTELIVAQGDYKGKLPMVLGHGE